MSTIELPGLNRIGSLNAYRNKPRKHMSERDQLAIRSSMMDIIEDVLGDPDEYNEDIINSLGVVVCCVQEYIDMRTLLPNGGEC